jgi:hypothetical protein
MSAIKIDRKITKYRVQKPVIKEEDESTPAARRAGAKPTGPEPRDSEGQGHPPAEECSAPRC